MESRGGAAWRVIVPLTFLSLTACGGGGGGSSSSDGYTGPAEPLSLSTEAKADLASGYTTTNVSLAEDMPSGTDVLSASTGPAAPAGLSTHLLVLNRETIPALFDTGQGRQPSATFDVTEQCAGGGKLSGYGSQASQNRISAGDEMSLTFSACDVGNGVVLNGGLSARFTAVEGDPTQSPPYGFTVRTRYNNLQMTMAGEKPMGLNGDLTLAFSKDSAGNSDANFNADTLVWSQGGEQHRLRNYRFRLQYNSSNNEQTFTAECKAASTLLGGEITVTTLEPLKGLDAAPYRPYAGKLRIQGANGSSAVLTVRSDAAGVLVSYDLDGDGNLEVTDKFMTWDKLEQALADAGA